METGWKFFSKKQLRKVYLQSLVKFELFNKNKNFLSHLHKKFTQENEIIPYSRENVTEPRVFSPFFTTK